MHHRQMVHDKRNVRVKHRELYVTYYFHHYYLTVENNFHLLLLWKKSAAQNAFSMNISISIPFCKLIIIVS